MRYGIGIIGFGGMGSWHAENITERIENLEVRGVYDISAAACARAEKSGFRVCRSIEELWADPQIQLVLVSTPNDFHYRYALRALEHDKHVICEKPVCLNSKQLNCVVEAAEKKGKLFTVHQNRRFDADFHMVQAVLERNMIGSPYFIHSRLFGSKGLPGDWRNCKISGGGMLYDWGVHLIDQMLYLIKSPVKSVFAVLNKVQNKEVDDCDKIVLRFENGVVAEIVVDTWCYLNEARWHISGEDGTLSIYGWPEFTGRLMKANTKQINWEEGVVFTSAGRTRTMAPRPEVDLKELPLPEIAPDEKNEWEYFYKNVLSVIEGKEIAFVTHEQMKNVMKVLDACFESAETNTVICF